MSNGSFGLIGPINIASEEKVEKRQLVISYFCDLHRCSLTFLAMPKIYHDITSLFMEKA